MGAGKAGFLHLTEQYIEQAKSFLEVKHIGGTENPADELTKTTPKKRLIELCR